MKIMDKSFLIKIFGYKITLIHGDTHVLDRWLWLKKFLPATLNNEKILDVGCGSGAYCFAACNLGYESVGISWDKKNNDIAVARSNIIGFSTKCTFNVIDVRNLELESQLFNQFDLVINTENIEHIIDDKKLINNIYSCLKPGGRLLLTAPNINYKAMTSDDLGPFVLIEDGAHVRKGYSPKMLEELCDIAGFKVETIEYCSGYFSQKITALLRKISRINPLLGWLFILPLRPIPVLFDRFICYENYSICLCAYKPRFNINK